VLAARLGLTEALMAEGWASDQAASDRLTADALVLDQPLGAITKLLPEQTRPTEGG
jgi:hypothetical protein